MHHLILVCRWSFLEVHYAGGHSKENGIRVCAALKTSLSCPLGHLQDLISVFFFSSQYPTFTPKSQISRNSTLQASKLVKSFVPKPQIGPKFCVQGYILLRNSDHLGPKFSSGPFTSPSVRSFGQHTNTKIKVDCPPPPDNKLHSWVL